MLLVIVSGLSDYDTKMKRLVDCQTTLSSTEIDFDLAVLRSVQNPFIVFLSLQSE